MDSIGIIVLNWRTSKLTIDTVNSLLKISHPGFKYQIYIVDNGSGDGSYQSFVKHFSHNQLIKIIDTGHNLGYVDGNNYGIQIATRDKHNYVLIINSDVLVKPDFLQILLNFLQQNSQYAMVGPKIYFAPGHEFHQTRYDARQIGKVIWSVGGKIDWDNIYGSNLGIDEVDTGQYDHNNPHVDYLSGCCLLIRSKIFQQIGLFDSRYFMYSEDADFSRRIISRGFKIAYISKSVIWHINSGSSGRGGIHDYFLSRNRLLFGFRYARLRTKLALIKDSVKILLFSPFVWQKIGVRDYYLNKLYKGSWL